MGDLTYQEARTIVQKHVGDSSDPTFIDQCLDLSILQFARARRWPELMKRTFFNTSAAYSTGTIAVAAEGTTWTLTSGTFPTDAATGLYRIALGIGDPWYTITTRTDGTNVETAAYQDAAQTASSYIAYKSQYSLASDVDRVEEIWVHDAGEAVPLINAATDQQVTQFTHYPSGPGVPTHYYNMERDANDYRQILLGPETPDDVYRVEYTYRKKATTGDLLGNFDPTRWRAILALTLSLAYAPDFYERSQVEYAKYRVLLAEEWGDENESETQSVQVGQNRYTYPGFGGMEYLITKGTVADPS